MLDKRRLTFIPHLALSRRAIQRGLGVLWLLDGLLKFQPKLWHAGFARSVIAPNASGQPTLLAWLVTRAVHLVLHGQDAWVTVFGVIEIAIGLGLLFPKSVKAALASSLIWGAAIWVFGEGFGGVLTGQTSPLMGAPGASILYAVLGALVWPTGGFEPKPSRDSEGLWSSSIAGGRYGLAGGLGVWSGLWFLAAILWLLPFNRTPRSTSLQIGGMSEGEPSWYGHTLTSLAHDIGTAGLPVACVFAALSLVVALGPLLSKRGEPYIVLGIFLAVLYWATGEAFGALFTLQGTDPSNGPIFVLLGLGLLPTVATDRNAASPAVVLFHRHRYLSSVGAGAIVLLPIMVAIVPAGAATAEAAPPSTAVQEAGISPGLPLANPINLNAATPPSLNLRLVAEPKRFDIGGKLVWGESYNGDLVGPTMHFVPGETVNLTLVNKLPTATNLHFHGMHISPSGDADNPYISVAPGKTFTYHFHIPHDQPLGTFWYHDHDMCMGNETMAMPGMATSTMPATNCQDIETQIYDGLSGTIVVGDDRSLLPADLRDVPVQTLALKDVQITSADRIVQNTANYSIDSNAPTVRLVDGQLQPVLTLRPGETELWRLANEGADIFYNLALPGYRFTIIGQDGYPVSKVTTANTLLLPPAKRWDVLVTAPTSPGSSWLKTLAYSNGPQGDSYPAVNLMKVNVEGARDQAFTMPKEALATTLPSIAGAAIAQSRTVRLSENAAGTEMYINGKQFDPNVSVFSTPAVLGTTEQWTIYNESGEIHPFHLHTEHFQVISINGVPQPYLGEQDVIPVPFKQHGVPGNVVIRVHFTDFTGKVMFHCHIAAHEDAGMMSYVNVVASRR